MLPPPPPTSRHPSFALHSLSPPLPPLSRVGAVALCLQGTLKGFDHKTNLILDESHERVYSTHVGVESVVLGLYIIRGDNM